jgi:hypothetical protein
MGKLQVKIYFFQHYVCIFMVLFNVELLFLTLGTLMFNGIK